MKYKRYDSFDLDKPGYITIHDNAKAARLYIEPDEARTLRLLLGAALRKYDGKEGFPSEAPEEYQPCQSCRWFTVQEKCYLDMDIPLPDAPCDFWAQDIKLKEE